jgi:tetratricopeptide (TPR) repeat protein
VAPPQLLKEGLPLPDEQPLIQPLIKLIGDADYEGALAFIRKSHGALLKLLEAGDPEGLVQQRASPGGLAPAPGGVAPPPTANRVSAALLYLIGHVYFALEKFRPAEIAFQDALIALPDYVRVHESLGLLYLRTKRYDEARKHLARAAALGLNTPQLYGALGYLNQQTENYWGAASAFQQALVMDHDNENWQRGLLNALNETRQYRPEIALVEQMLRKHPDDSDLWLYRAQAAISAGEQQLALASLETAIRLGNDSVANKQVCATLHMQEGSVARAIELLKGGAAQGMDFEFLSQALDWLAQKGEWDYLRDLAASLDKRRSSLSGPDRSKLLTQEASLHLHDNRRQAAKTALQSALDLDPSNAGALMTLGKIYRDDHDYNRAELLFQRASAYDLYRENAIVALAQLAVDQENYPHAVELLQGVIKSDPTRTDLQRNIDSLQDLARLRTPN